MLQKFTPEHVGASHTLKKSVQRNFREKIVEQYPNIGSDIEKLLPKSEDIISSKCADNMTAYSVAGECLFFQHWNGPVIPTLRVLHRFPNMLPKFQVDAGATKFIMRGVSVMCPGLTSPGASMDDVPKGAVVQIVCENRPSVCAIGVTTLSTAEIREINKDIAVTVMHHLGDGLWENPIILPPQ